MTKYTEDEADAIGAANDLARSFEKRGWQTLESGLAAGYAWVRLGAEAHDDVQAFLAVDPDAHEDRYLYGPYTASEDALPAIAEAPDRYAAMDICGQKSEHVASVPPIVPPTSAAHMQEDEAVPPIVPPTEDSHAVENAAHLDRHGIEHNDMRTSAAHMQDDELADAAHPDEDDRLSGEMGKQIIDQAREHIRAAEADGDVYSQMGTYDAVREQVASRLWSPVASEFPDDVLLKMVRGKEVTWRNSISGKRDSAVVSKDGSRHAKVTRSSLAEEPGAKEDLRILHFLEQGGGFRSVAVARIVHIG